MSATLGSGLPDHTLSPNMQRVYEDGVRAASSGANILILGEDGVGKEVLARWLHAVSPRARKPLLAVNCAALPESCIDEELCGSRLAGARVPQGCLERADGGAILLDEIGEMEIEPLESSAAPSGVILAKYRRAGDVKSARSCRDVKAITRRGAPRE